MKGRSAPSNGQVDLEFHERILNSGATLSEIAEYLQSLIDSGVAYRLHGWPLLLMADMRRIGFLDHGVALIDNGYPDLDAPHPATPDGSMH